MVIVIMGCTTSLYDNPEITRKQAENQSIIRRSPSGRPEHATNYNNHSANGTTHNLTSKLKRSKVSPYIDSNADENIVKITSNGGHIESQIPNGHKEENSTENRQRLDSPARSDRTDMTNRSIKRVMFTDQPARNLEHSREGLLESRRGLGDESVPITGSPTDRKKARRKREKTLRKRLLDKMGEAESMSERLLMENERLSLTSSMSRATSRAGSPLPTRAHNYQASAADDNMTEASSVAPATPRESFHPLHDDEAVSKQEHKVSTSSADTSTASDKVTVTADSIQSDKTILDENASEVES